MTLVGAVAALEAIKAITSHHVPVNQWFFYEASDVLTATIGQVRMSPVLGG